MSCKGCPRCFHGYNSARVFPIHKGQGILVIDQNGQYNVPGGFVDHPCTGCISSTAARELYEETRGVLNVTAARIRTCPWVDIDNGRHKSRCYFLTLTDAEAAGICRKFYATDVSKLPRAFQETTAMTRFNIAQWRHRPITCTAVTDRGISTNLFWRAVPCITQGMAAGYL